MDLLNLPSEAVLTGVVNGDASRLVVGGLLVRGEGAGARALVLKRRYDVEYGGFEELPSGGVEGGETLAEALTREIAEETGILHVTPTGFLSSFFYGSARGMTLQLNYLVRFGSDESVVLDESEHVSYRWVSESELDSTHATDTVKKCMVEGFRRLRERR